jgi:hypothetical protein
MANMSYLFINSHPVLDHVRPLTPKIQYFGGIGLTTKTTGAAKKADEEKGGKLAETCVYSAVKSFNVLKRIN